MLRCARLEVCGMFGAMRSATCERVPAALFTKATSQRALQGLPLRSSQGLPRAMASQEGYYAACDDRERIGHSGISAAKDVVFPDSLLRK